MDEVGFGPGRETRLPSRRLRVLAAVAATAAAGAIGVVAVRAASSQHAVTAPRPATQSAAALPDPARLLPSAGCPPVQTSWPSLAGLPAAMRPGALPVIADAQFSGRCPAPR